MVTQQRDLFGSILESLSSDDPQPPQQLAVNEEIFTETVKQSVEAQSSAFDEPVDWDGFTHDDYVELAEAFLKNSIERAFGVSRGGANYKQDTDAQAWLFIQDDAYDDADPLSFKNCVKAIGLDPEELRNLLKDLYLRRFTP